jgi:hypothetical protein
MSLGAITGFVVLATALILGLRARARLRGLRRGDLVKAPIPRQLAGPLAVGTRLDIGAALKKAGVPPDKIRPLLDGQHDQELLDRYWALADHQGTPVVG